MKYIFFLAFIFIGITGFSQNATLDKTLGYDETYLWYTGTSTDVLTVADSTWMYTVRKKTDSKIQCYVDLLIDSTGGTANNVVFYLQNKKFAELDFTTVATVTWNGTNVTSDGKVISFAPSSQSFALTTAVRDSISGTLSLASIVTTSRADTAGFKYYPADTVWTTIPTQIGTISAIIKKATIAMTVTESDQFNMGEYWRVSIVGANNTLLASIRRLNFKFVKQ